MDTSLFAVFQQSTERFPEKAALIYQKQTYSYQQLMDDALSMAARLRSGGVQRHDRVVVCCGNRPETIVAFWAVLAVGATVALISPEQSPAKIHFILADSQATALVTEIAHLEKLADGLAPLDDLRCVLLVDEVEPREAISEKLVLACNAPIAPEASGIAPTISEDLAALIYTSGSTGMPKGVMMSHANMLCALASLNQYLQHCSDDVFLNVLPLSFDYGLYQSIMAVSVGATLVLERDMVLPLQAMKQIARHRCTVVPGVPVFFELLNQFSRFARFDFSSVRAVTNTGAALLPKHIAIIKGLFPQAAIFSMYGLTECKRCTYLPPHLIDEKPESVGIAIPNTEILVVDEENCPCPPYQVGQLIVRGGTVMQGYWRRPDDTARKIRQHPIVGGRCLYTGDYGYLDQDGCFYFKGRMDEVMKVRGRKLIPREIEDVLRRCEGVEEAAIICTSAEQGDYQIVAFLECAGGKLDEAPLRAECRRSLEAFQIPHLFVCLERLPRNQNGKIDKPLLQQQIPQTSLSKEL